MTPEDQTRSSGAGKDRDTVVCLGLLLAGAFITFAFVRSSSVVKYYCIVSRICVYLYRASCTCTILCAPGKAESKHIHVAAE